MQKQTDSITDVQWGQENPNSRVQYSKAMDTLYVFVH